MDGKQGIQLVQLISPKLTIPIHIDDYDVFLVSPPSSFMAVASTYRKTHRASLWNDSLHAPILKRRSPTLALTPRSSTSKEATSSSLAFGPETGHVDYGVYKWYE